MLNTLEMPSVAVTGRQTLRILISSRDAAALTRLKAQIGRAHV